MIRILSDSTCDLSQELLQRYGIGIIPLNIVLDGKSYEDGRDISPDQIYAWADEHKSVPKTAACAPGRVKEIFEKYLQKDEEMICFSLSASMSSTYDIMRAVARETGAENKISVINSQSLSTGNGLLVITAAEMALSGMKRQEIVDEIKKLRSRVSASFVVDTLSYLHRGGRCSGVSALLGTTLRLHPQISVTDGKMQPGQKYRGKMHKVIAEYTQDHLEEMKTARKNHVFVTHSGCGEKELTAALSQVQALNYFDEIHVTRAGGVISSHCGPGTLGVLYIRGEE
ncbi:MAG: DegV family protein [Clostridia bacterium]|nr:DegV family protein [Clostridia bacterium]